MSKFGETLRQLREAQNLAGYLFIALSSEHGRRRLKARAFGSSIPHLDVRIQRNSYSTTPAAAAVRETLKAAINQGWGEENASALIKALELQAGATVGG